MVKVDADFLHFIEKKYPPQADTPAVGAQIRKPSLTEPKL